MGEKGSLEWDRFVDVIGFTYDPTLGENAAGGSSFTALYYYFYFILTLPLKCLASFTCHDLHQQAIEHY